MGKASSAKLPSPPRTFDEIRDLFTNSGDLRRAVSPSEDVFKLVLLIREGDVQVEVIAFDRHVNAVPSDLPRKWNHGGESTEHLLLKLNAAHWLAQVGAQRVLPEKRVDGYKPDLIAEDLGWIVECGDTEVRKCLNLMMLDGWEAFVVVPYPMTYEEGHLAAFKFTTNDEARDRFFEARMAALQPLADTLEKILFGSSEEPEPAPAHGQETAVRHG
jgi:hypothetical protein